MLEAALFRHDRIPRYALDCGFDRVAFEVGNAHSVFGKNRHLAIAEKKDIARVLENGWDIRSDEELAVTQTNHDRRSLPHGNDSVRFVGVDDRKSKDSAQVARSVADGTFETVALLQIFFDQMSDDFRVS